MDLIDNNKCIDILAENIHNANVKKGFWPENKEERNKSEILMLIVGELSEAQEALRDNNRCTLLTEEKLHLIDLANDPNKTEEFKELFKARVKDTFEDEMIDSLVRQLDAIQGFNIDLLFHLYMKLYFNSLRPHKHGKNF